MQVRLAFAVMVHVDADLLLIDEVLAVGDASFQQKCYDVLHQAKRDGRTILLVTHDMDQVQRFCDRAMLLERGDLVCIGDSRDVARRYSSSTSRRATPAAEPLALEERAGSDAGARWSSTPGCRTARACGPRRSSRAASCALCMRVRFLADTDDPVFGFELADPDGRAVFAASTEWAERAAAQVHRRRGRRRRGDLRQLVRARPLRDPGRASRQPGTAHRVMAEQGTPTTFVVTGTRAGGGIVDVPHAFSLFRAGAESEQLDVSDVAVPRHRPRVVPRRPQALLAPHADAGADRLEGPVLRVGARLPVVAAAAADALRDPVLRLQRGRGRRGHRRTTIPIVLLSGMMLYFFFGEVTGASATSLVDREALVRKVGFPRMVVPLAVALVGAFNLLLNLVGPRHLPRDQRRVGRAGPGC